MSHIKAGDYWSATNETEDSWWLFLIVAHATANRRRYVLAVKCDWKTRAPLISDDFTDAWWFLDPDGGCANKDVEFFLAAKQRGHGRRFLRPPNDRA